MEPKSSLIIKSSLTRTALYVHYVSVYGDTQMHTHTILPWKIKLSGNGC